MQSAPHRPLGLTILEAVQAARVAADTNANLGIVLLTAPLAAVSDGEPLDDVAVARVLGRLDRDDAAAVYRAIAVGRRIRAGQVQINDGAFNICAPFGGYGQSGNGREFGRWGLEEFLETKSMQLP